MATTKIPIVIGNKPAKFITQNTSPHDKIYYSISRNCIEKLDGFERENLISNISTEEEDEQSEDDWQGDRDSFVESEDVYIDPTYDDAITYENRHANITHFSTRMLAITGLLKLKKRKANLINKDRIGISYNLVDYLMLRTLGQTKAIYSHVNRDYGSVKMINDALYKENIINISTANKIFCSEWLSDEQIVMGTKCNKLLIYNISTEKLDYIPSLKGLDNNSVPLSEQCGIHALKFNPSRSLMATGGHRSNDIAIYRLPTLDPLCMGQQAHSDWIFDICWLDDQFMISASRDKSLALWKIDDSYSQYCDSLSYGYIDPVCKKRCYGADKVRSVIFNPNYMEIVALSLNAKIHIWDATSFKQIMSQKLELSQENVCIAKNDSCSLYAVGSKSHTTLIDPRTLQSISKIDTKKGGPSIRSISFRKDLLISGTGNGDILFFDIKAGRFLEASQGPLELNCTKCKISIEDASFQMYVPENNLTSPAIYTHCYDWSGTRLFAAGGPLSSTFNGSYAAVWC